MRYRFKVEEHCLTALIAALEHLMMDEYPEAVHDGWVVVVTGPSWMPLRDELDFKGVDYTVNPLTN